METEFVDFINKLDGLFKTANIDPDVVRLPRIVVVGEQSSGKSSVLESLVGRPCLPRGTNMVTRCPIVLEMFQMDRSDPHYQQISRKLKAEEWVEFPHLPEGQQLTANFDHISDIISLEVDARAGGKEGKVIVPEELVLRISSPNVVNLTVVDLPGIVRMPPELEEEIYELLMRYIETPHNIILAVSSACHRGKYQISQGR